MFEYRGFLLDSVRHMQSVEEIAKLVDAIARLGFNKLHWHLTDDQGWRFECETYPELNGAAVRPYSDFGRTRIDEPYGRVYTKDEMRRVVSICAERGVEVVPEFDVPGHASALLSVLGQLSCTGEKAAIKTHQGIFPDVLCLAKEETFEVVTRILDEFLEVFPGEYIHIGGDETPSDHWKRCPACREKMKQLGVTSFAAYQNCFMNRFVEYLSRKNRRCIVWNDAVKGGNLDKRAIIQYWKERDGASVRFLNEGGRAILSPFSYCYLDYGFDITPLNRVFSLRADLPGLTAVGKTGIIGIEGNLWTEYIGDDETLEKRAFPRIIAVADKACCRERGSYAEFLEEVRRIRDELPRIAFEDERVWTRTRASHALGWLRFVRQQYTWDYIREQITKKGKEREEQT